MAEDLKKAADGFLFAAATPSASNPVLSARSPILPTRKAFSPAILRGWTEMEEKSYGYAGKNLRVNLTTGEKSVFSSKPYQDMYMGSKGMLGCDSYNFAQALDDMGLNMNDFCVLGRLFRRTA